MSTISNSFEEKNQHQTSEILVNKSFENSFKNFDAYNSRITDFYANNSKNPELFDSTEKHWSINDVNKSLGDNWFGLGNIL